MPLVGGVIAATIVQGITSFTLTQLLSKEAQRLIAEMRAKVQAHVLAPAGRLLRRQQDRRARLAHHERRRGRANLIGTGLVEFVGGLLTAALALVVLLRINAPMTLHHRDVCCSASRSS
jgi:subfamily B ATP-binding cassette protein MsbA